jgi:DNA uptake protein ComE-like DNA-binding protein
MLNRQAAVSQSGNCQPDNSPDAWNRQIILVLLGLGVAFFRIINFFTTQSNPQTIQDQITSDFAVAYQAQTEGAALFFVGGHGKADSAVLQSTASMPADIAPLFFQPIPINSASPNLLVTIPGIGPHLAKAIHDYIAQNGPLTRVSDLKHVKGIGEKKSIHIARYARI